MAKIFRPGPRKEVPTGKLKIDWSHPLTRDLVGCYLPGYGGENLVGIGGDLTYQSGVVKTICQEGPAAITTATSGLSGLTPPSFYAGNLFSFFWRGYVAANATGYSPILQISHTGTWTAPYVFFGARANNSGTTGVPGILFQVSEGGYTEAPIGALSWVAGRTNSVGGSVDMATASSSRGFVNGVYGTVSNANSTKVTPVAGQSQINIATTPGSGAGSSLLNAQCHIACFWTRQLSDAEHAYLDADPYCFLISGEDEISSTGSGTVAVVSGTLATTEAPDIAFIVGAGAVLSKIYTRFGFEGYGVRRAGNFSRAAAGASGTLTAAEAADTAVINGSVAITGTLATTEAQDTASITGSGVAPSGTLAATEAQDVAAIVGTAGGAAGTLVVTEAKDVAVFTGSFAVPSGILVTTEAPDVCAIVGSFAGVATGTLAVTEANDNAQIFGSFVGLPLKAGKVPYPSRHDYGWFDGKPPPRRF